MNFKTLSVAAPFVLSLVLPLSAVANDRLVMKNGDTITGEISKIVDDEVWIDPGYADEFAVDIAEVVSVHTDQPFEIELPNEEIVNGQIELTDAGEQVVIIDGTARPVSLADIARAEEPEPYYDWSATVNFNATDNSGNTDSYNTLLYGAGMFKHGDHRHTGDLTFAREEIDGNQTKDQDLLNYNYNWLFADPWYMGGSFTYERDPVRELDHRYTAGLIFGRDIFDTSSRFLSISIGLGYSDEEIGGVSTSGSVGLWKLNYTQAMWSGIDFFHNDSVTYQFYDNNNTIIKTNTGFMFDLWGDLYANLSFRYDYETEPAPGVENYDSTLAVGLGYDF
ncbi:DUF481 domain-containing protein [Marinihelvus fidelis]|uniref:DUF481 domain-containing protein n=1 Tax=Marinihelvus fidelis TaxID=2613842 RepID=A0A5N0T8T0_9GAMM|nr:DUF481 domain-containing protein [Marinihelvus fidelis]KAA9130547.1 DUF481 domain-containing protein [Marinihelvus fidelis]